VKKGEFLGIIGIVGSGKSSLVSAILGNFHSYKIGELFRTKGAHYTHGSISYVG
jgi:ABC-type Mn2+/Zn2+ transport system ATPase subunit